MFDIIDTDKEGFVDWDKFCSHMQRDYQEKDERLKTTQVCWNGKFGFYVLINEQLANKKHSKYLINQSNVH